MPDKQIAALTRCFYCGEGSEILIGKRLQDMSKYDGKVIDKRPCPKCEGYMKQGVIVITVRDGEEGDNPYRTGGFFVLRDEAITRMVNNDELRDDILKRRVLFMPDAVAKAVGLVK